MDFNGFVEEFIDQLDEYDGGEISKETNFRDLDDWDSLTGVAVQVMIADKYGSKIPDNDFIQANTVGDLFDLALKYKK